MGEIAVLFSERRERLRKEFVDTARRIETADINFNAYSSAVLEQFHELACNPAVNYTPYQGEAAHCLELQRSTVALLQAFDDLTLFAIHVLHGSSTRYAA